MSPQFWVLLGAANAVIAVMALVGAMATDKPQLAIFGLVACAFLALNAWGLLA